MPCITYCTLSPALRPPLHLLRPGAARRSSTRMRSSAWGTRRMRLRWSASPVSYDGTSPVSHYGIARLSHHHHYINIHRYLARLRVPVSGAGGGGPGPRVAVQRQVHRADAWVGWCRAHTNGGRGGRGWHCDIIVAISHSISQLLSHLYLTISSP